MTEKMMEQSRRRRLSFAIRTRDCPVGRAAGRADGRALFRDGRTAARLCRRLDHHAQHLGWAALAHSTVGLHVLDLWSGGLLFHAAHETETQLRRSYGFLGFGLVAVAIGLAVMPQQDAAMGVLFLPWGAIAGLLGLFFLMPFAHNETDPFYRTLSIRVLGGVGAAAALVGFVGGNASADFLVSPGVVYIIFGLLYLWATIGLLGTNSERGYRLALAVGAREALAFLVALARSLAPMLSSSVSRYFLPSGLLLMASGAIYALFALRWFPITD